MYAIIDADGRQYKVETGQIVKMDFREVEPETAIEFDRVLLVSDGESISIGAPIVAGAKVTGTIMGEIRGEKLVIQKFRRRKNYRRKTGHRQTYTKVRIDAISV
jgi:large subunit ribosomal protein L21